MRARRRPRRPSPPPEGATQEDPLPRRVDQLLARAKLRLAATPRASAREAGLLLSHVLAATEVELLAHPERPVGAGDAARFEALIERRLAGEPVAYLVGEREFYGRAFLVDRRVLVPRPETEHLVEAALAWCRSRHRSAEPGPRLLDLGTGSGCVAVTLALETGLAVVATDLSVAALAVARSNRDRHRAAVRLAAARTLDGLDLRGFDLVVSNLPYLDPQESHRLDLGVLRWEPAGALFAGPGGLDRFRELFASATALRPGARLLLEIGADQGAAVSALAAQYHLRWIETIRDYAGSDRVLVIER